MAKITATEYTPKTKAEAPNPFIDALKPFADAGVDTAFRVEFDAGKYNTEKLQIQRAMNEHGFSAREVEVERDGEGDDAPILSATFVVRPPRKRKAKAADDAPESDADGE